MHADGIKSLIDAKYDEMTFWHSIGVFAVEMAAPMTVYDPIVGFGPYIHVMIPRSLLVSFGLKSMYDKATPWFVSSNASFLSVLE